MVISLAERVISTGSIIRQHVEVDYYGNRKELIEIDEELKAKSFIVYIPVSAAIMKKKNCLLLMLSLSIKI